jgi:predicted O-linked N-acetylglucosamine transferase (SPINDLY family)
MMDSWSRILLKVPRGVLWISKNNASFQANLLKEFGKRNITSDRIIFAERIDLMADHLARYRMADLFLDTLPYNAHTTALDALKTGVPLLTCIGQSFPARVAASLLTTLQMPDLITHTQEEYEKLAVTLANNSDQYQQIKDRLAQNLMTSPLFNSQLFTHHLEELYLNMYQTHLDNRVRS